MNDEFKKMQPLKHWKDVWRFFTNKKLFEWNDMNIRDK